MEVSIYSYEYVYSSCTERSHTFCLKGGAFNP